LSKLLSSKSQRNTPPNKRMQPLGVAAGVPVSSVQDLVRSSSLVSGACTEPMTKEVYGTLLSTDDYLPGVLVLNKSLKLAGAKYPLVCILSHDISDASEEILRRFQIQTIRLDGPVAPHSRHGNEEFAHWAHTWDKLELFRLTQFEKVVFLDSDMLILSNIDELFEMSSVSAVCAGARFPGNESWVALNSGLMVLTPDSGTYEGMVDCLPEIQSKKGNFGDQECVDEYLKRSGAGYNRLDDQYNLFQVYLDHYIGNLGYSLTGRSGRQIKVIHYIGTEKPWVRKGLLSKLELLIRIFRADGKYQAAAYLMYYRVLREFRTVLPGG